MRVLKNLQKFRSVCESDISRYTDGSGLLVLIKLLTTNPGFRVVFLIRIITLKEKNIFLDKFLRIHILKNYGCDIALGLKIGPGLRIDHPVGIVIGGGVQIGENCSIGQGVTIGEKFIDARSDGRYPILGNSVMIGAGSALIGQIQIGDSVTIGARTLVLGNVPALSRVVGVWK